MSIIIFRATFILWVKEINKLTFFNWNNPYPLVFHNHQTGLLNWPEMLKNWRRSEKWRISGISIAISQAWIHKKSIKESCSKTTKTHWLKSTKCTWKPWYNSRPSTTKATNSKSTIQATNEMIKIVKMSQN